MQKSLQEEFPQAHIIFMHCEKNIDKALAITCGLGFDLVCDYGGYMETNRRSIIKMLGIFGRIITKTGGGVLQFDPPEIAIFSQLNA
jgi:threonine dehydrogenase-like Zn-dependent dehydrogenase